MQIAKDNGDKQQKKNNLQINGLLKHALKRH